MNIETPHLYQPRPHHDPSGWEIEENHVTSCIARKGFPTLVPVLHVHKTGLTLIQADEIIKEEGRADRWTVTGIQGCTSPKDKDQPPGTFILLKRK
jgi:hypothetical protein